MKTKETVKIPVQFRAATVEPKSIDEEKRTAEVIFTTGARVKRFSFFSGEFFEELGLEKKNVRLDRLNNGAPLLNNHSNRSLDDVIGVVENAVVDGKEGRATVRFSDRENVEPIFNDVKKGIIRNISIGFRIHKLEKVGEENDIPILRATDWEPMEISAVTIPADAGAQFRSEESENDCMIVGCGKRNEIGKDEPSQQYQPRIEPEPNKIVESQENLRQDQSKGEVIDMSKEKEKDLVKEARNEATQAEKKRQTDIRFAVRAAGLDEKVAQEYIDADTPVDEVRTAVITQLAEKDQETPTRNQTIEVKNDEHKTRLAGFENAILHRYDSAKYPLDENGKQYRHAGLIDMAKTCLEAHGVRTSDKSKMQVAELALKMRGLHSISDFPELLANTANKTLRQAFSEAPQTFAPFTRQVVVTDFKEVARIQLGDAPDLLELPENGEIERGTLGEAAEKYSVKDFARIIGISRKMIVNDDLSGFTRIPELMGRAARDLESDTVWDIIKANAALADTIPLYDAGHSNLGSAAVPSETTLGEFRRLMRKQVGLNGRLLNTQLAWLWVPTALETTVEKLIATTQPNATSEVNPFGPQGRTPLQMIVEPRLDASAGGSDTAYYGSASLGQIDMLELARLQGEEGPVIESREGFDVLGMEMSVRHAVGAKAIEFRGLVKNAG